MGKGDVGEWDPALFARYRALDPAGPEARAVLGELLRVNEPLVEDLVLQRAGRKPSRGMGKGRLVVRGADAFSASELLAIGRVAFVVAMQTFDPARGKLAGALNWKVLDELRRAVQERGIVMRGRRRRLADMRYFEDDQALCEAFEAGEIRTPGAAEKRRAPRVDVDGLGRAPVPAPATAPGEERSPPAMRECGGATSRAPASEHAGCPTRARERQRAA